MPQDDQMIVRRRLRDLLTAALTEADMAGLTDAGIWIDRAIATLMEADNVPFDFTVAGRVH